MVKPPWSMWPQVVEKLMGSRCAAICICPAWSGGWVQTLVRAAPKRVYIEQGARIFEMNGKPSSSTFWGVWALGIPSGERILVDKAQDISSVFLPRWRPLKTLGLEEEKSSEEAVINISKPQKIHVWCN